MIPIFRQRLTLLKAVLCTIVIFGVTLVVQPPFIFQSNMAHTSYPKYSLGIIIGLLCAFSAALLNVSSAMVKSIARVQLMLYGGCATLLIGLLGHYFSYLEPNFLISMTERACMTVGVAVASIFGGHLLVVANQVKRVCYLASESLSM